MYAVMSLYLRRTLEDAIGKLLKRTEPEEGVRKPSRIESKVDFPEPDAPIIPIISPGKTDRLIF